MNIHQWYLLLLCWYNNIQIKIGDLIPRQRRICCLLFALAAADTFFQQGHAVAVQIDVKRLYTRFSERCSDLQIDIKMLQILTPYTLYSILCVVFVCFVDFLFYSVRTFKESNAMIDINESVWLLNKCDFGQYLQVVWKYPVA